MSHEHEITVRHANLFVTPPTPDRLGRWTVTGHLDGKAVRRLIFGSHMKIEFEFDGIWYEGRALLVEEKNRRFLFLGTGELRYA